MMIARSISPLLIAVLSITSAEVYFRETFPDQEALDAWVVSKHKDDYGKVELSHGKYFGDAKRDLGLKTSQDAHFYDIAKKFDKPFSNEGKDLIVQFTVKHEQDIDCGGGYIKLLPDDVDLNDFHGESPYYLMFGPDKCGYDKKTHAILNYNGKNHLIKKSLSMKDDELTHMYTFILKKDNTYEFRIDGEKSESGSLEKDWDMLPPKKIPDPNAKKPDDWVDKEYIDDPDDKKPADWDKPEHISDPDAKKPEDWDDDMDGEWEPPMIDNPEYKGEWKPKKIKNPEYKGEWVHPEIDNPDYKEDDKLYARPNWGAVGIDIWQVKSGSIFDNIIICDDIKEAEEFGKETFFAMKDQEKKLKEEADEEESKRKEEERKKKKEERAKKKEEGKDDEEEIEWEEEAEEKKEKGEEKEEVKEGKEEEKKEEKEEKEEVKEKVGEKKDEKEKKVEKEKVRKVKKEEEKEKKEAKKKDKETKEKVKDVKEEL